MIDLIRKIKILLTRTEYLEEHNHGIQLVSPSGAAPITVTSGGGAWALGNFSNDIIAAGAVALDFDIHFVSVSAESANANYELVLYYGAADTVGAYLVFSRTNPTLSSHQLRVMTPLIPGGSRVRAKLMDSAGGSACAVKVMFHTYA